MSYRTRGAGPRDGAHNGGAAAGVGCTGDEVFFRI